MDFREILFLIKIWCIYMKRSIIESILLINDMKLDVIRELGELNFKNRKTINFRVTLKY